MAVNLTLSLMNFAEFDSGEHVQPAAAEPGSPPDGAAAAHEDRKPPG